MSVARYKHGNLVDVVLDFFGRRNLSDLIGQNIPSNELRRLARFLKGRFVVFNEHNPARGLNRAGRPKGGKIEDVEIRGADRYQFIRDGTSITVAVNKIVPRISDPSKLSDIIVTSRL